MLLQNKLSGINYSELCLSTCRVVGGLWVRLGQNQMCQCAVPEFQNILCGGKKIKYEALGCRVGKKTAVKFICRPVVSIICLSV
jgi:hypothetical protein